MRSSANPKGPFGRLIERLFYEEQWGVGLIAPHAFWRGADRGQLADDEIEWLAMPSNGFLADPCWLSESEGLFLAERVQYSRRTGRIVLCKAESGSARIVRELELPSGHHSFPMTYRQHDEAFLVPEAAARQRISRAQIAVDGRLGAERVMIEGRELVDPILFEAAEIFWLFANPLGDWNNELAVFSAPAIDGPWEEAKFSPLAIGNCRGAGKIIVRDGERYWPTQYNRDRYGGGLILRRIAAIGDRGLDQSIFATLLPDPAGCYPLGLHTVSEGADHYLIDGLRMIFRPTKVVDVLLSRFRLRGGRQ